MAETGNWGWDLKLGAGTGASIWNWGWNFELGTGSGCWDLELGAVIGGWDLELGWDLKWGLILGLGFEELGGE